MTVDSSPDAVRPSPSHRPLGLWENVITIAQRRSATYNVSSKFRISSTKEIQNHHVEAAARKLARKHPLLRSVVARVDGIRSFVVNDATEPVVRFSDVSDGHAVMEKELFEVFDDSKCLWRVTKLKTTDNVGDKRYSNTFIFTFHHAIVDGMSIVQLYRDFLTFLERALRGLGHDVISLPLKPSRDVIFKDRQACSALRRLRHTISYLFYDCISPTIQEDPLVSKLIEAFRPSTPTRSTRCIEINFDENETESIVKTCRSRGVKVNAFFSASASRALRQLMIDHNVIGRNDVIGFHSECYVNLRRFTEELNSEDIGLYLTHVPTSISIGPSGKTFWQDATSCNNKLHASLDSGSFFDDYALYQSALKSLGPENVAKVISFTDHRSMPYYISNLGKMELYPQIDDVRENHICRFEELHQTFGEYMTLVDGSVFIHSIATVNGRTFWTLGYHSHQVSDNVAQDLARLLKDIMVFESCQGNVKNS